MITTLPPGLRSHFSSGDAAVTVALNADRRGSDLAVLLKFSDRRGITHVVQLSPSECAELAADLLVVCQAGEAQREIWRLELEYDL